MTERPADAQRLMDAYAKAVRRLTAAENALRAAEHPADYALVYAHHSALEDFQTIRRVLAASIRDSTALLAVEEFRP